MLTSTKQKLDALYCGGRHRGIDGKLYEIDLETRISVEQGETIASLHRSLRPILSIEVGLAYGFSTLFILDAMKEGRYGRHIAIDPFQVSYWHGIGLRALREAGLSHRFWPSNRFRWTEERSSFAISQMIRTETKAQFAYIDGAHLFDDTILDFSLTDKILDVGGLVLLDDLWLPAVRRVVNFVSKNMAYERVEVGCKNLAVFKKTAFDQRPWNHFEDF